MTRVVEMHLDDPRWAAFVSSCETATAYHSPEVARCYADTPGFEVFPLFAENENGIHAAAVAMLVPSRMPVLGGSMHRLILYASPLYRDSPEGRDGVEGILTSLREIARNRAFFLEIRNSEPFPHSGDEEATHQMWFVPRINYIIDLHDGTDSLFARLSSKTRNRIRKAEKRGIEVRELRDAQEMGTAQAMVVDLYRRRHVPLPPAGIFDRAWADLRPAGCFHAIGAFKADHLVATRFLLRYRSTVIDWFAASEPEHHGDYPNEALVWHALRWASAAGCSRFDFGGGGVRGREYGPGRFKEKFPVETVEYGRYRWSRWPRITRIAELVYGRLSGTE